MRTNDQYGRTINYMRISLTDQCNLRCTYCMPLKESGCQKHVLPKEKIADLVRQGAKLGINKIRLTGGEPLIRPDIIDIVRSCARTPGIDSVNLTTNGVLLKKYAKELKEAGLDRINISLDTLDPERYHRLTRVGSLEDVLEGIQAAQEAGFDHIKINSVLMGGPDGLSDEEIIALTNLTRENNISIRFIELMPMGECQDWDRECFLKNDHILKVLPDLKLIGTDGVTEEYAFDGAKGRVGLISPMSHRFCKDCNRIRITADGKLKPCLHSKEEYDLMPYSEDELRDMMHKFIYLKPEQHLMDETHHSQTKRNMNAIGG